SAIASRSRSAAPRADRSQRRRPDRADGGEPRQIRSLRGDDGGSRCRGGRADRRAGTTDCDGLRRFRRGGGPWRRTTAISPGDQINLQVKALTAPWYRYFLSYDPAPALASLACPVLALNGEKDLQVPAAQNLPAIRRALAHNTSAQVEQLPGLNHLFQTAPT